MKKISLMLLVMILFTCVSCQEGTTPIKPEIQILSVQYFDEDTLLLQNIYTKDDFELETYTKNDYDFNGWYLDKDYNEPFNKKNLDQYFEMKVIALYAKMSKVMKTNNIQIKGLVEGKTVLNPAFTWNNENEDSTFKIELYNNTTLVFSEETANTYIQSPSLLTKNTDYKLKVTGMNSNYCDEIEFTTGSYDHVSKEISVDNPFMNNMVIQRDQETIFTGTAAPNELIIVEDGDTVSFGLANEAGKYVVKQAPKSASFDPKTIKITNGIDKSMELTNVLYGDVYFFAGQSNMQWPTTNSDYLYSDVTRAKESNVRFFCQDVVTSTTKLDSVKNGRWFAIDNSNYNYFSAIAFMSGSMLSYALKSEVPIGILSAYQGDTNIANWMGDDYYQGSVATKYLHYNAMVYPLRHTKINGVVWYQGCNNSGAAGEYKDLLLNLFANYRDLFNSPNTPFFVIGLCCYNGDSGNNYDFSYVRESQAKACAEDDNAYFISTCDNGDPGFIHPSTKRYICERVSKSIQSVIYNKDYMAEGPTYKSHKVEGNKVIIDLYNALGLKATGEIEGMYIAGEDGKYLPAEAHIEGEQIIATSAVANPVYVKYGFSKSPFVNIFNKDGFAVTPFRTDDLNENIDLLNYASLDNYKFHPDGSKMDIEYYNGNLKVTKNNDGKTYGSVQLDVWGMLTYLPEGFRFTVVGTGSNATIAFRIIEGSYEIWSYKVVDNFVGEKTFEISVGEFNCVYNKQDGILNTQKINYIEVMVEHPTSATFEIKEARFIPMEKTAPLNFSLAGVTENETSIVVTANKSIFASSYSLIITDNGTDLSNPIYETTQTDLVFNVDKKLFTSGKPYYVFVNAINELGTTPSSTNGTTFYLKNDNEAVVCNFDFADQKSLDAYVASSMSVHDGLKVTLEEEGVKITSTGAGWQQFIFKLETGLGKSMTKLVFDADFSNYKGSVVLQLADTSWNVYEYKLDLSKQKSGTFTINLSDFKTSGGVSFTTQNLMWVMFNFNDTVGNGYILFDDCKLTK